jgi:uncharacterized membrane protein
MTRVITHLHYDGLTRMRHDNNARCARRFLFVIGMILTGLTLVFWWPGSIASLLGGILLVIGFLLWFIGYITA